MRFATISLLVVCGPLVLVGCSTTGESNSGTAVGVGDEAIAVEGQRVVLTVYGMSCPLCATNVDKMLLEVPGVDAVQVDMGTGTAHVTLDGRTRVTRGQLAQAVERSGFTLQRIETP